MFLLQLVLVILSIKIAGQLSVRFGQPSVLGKILVGILLGPALLGWVQDGEALKAFSEIGVLLLMFLAGLEMNMKVLNENKVSATFVAIGGILFPILFTYIGASFFDFTFEETVFLGLLLSATSVSISVQTLREIGWLKSREGSTLMGAAIIDDVVVVILIAIAVSIFTSSSETSLSMLFMKKIMFFVIIALVSKRLVSPFMKIFSKFRVTEPVLSSALIICFSFAYIAEYLGVAGIIGSFFAGVTISRTAYKQDIEHKVEAIANGIFVPFFFVSIGLSVTFNGINEQIGFVVLFSLLAVASKFLGAGIGARLTGFNRQSAMGIGAGMVSRGEVALILVSIGLETRLIPIEYFTAVVLVIIVSTIVTPPLLKRFFGERTECLMTD